MANINLDAGELFWLTRDLGSTGYGLSTPDEVLETAAKNKGRVFVAESFDGTGGFYFRSDQIEFAKAGIPAVFPWSGFDYVGKPGDFGERVWDENSSHRYHHLTGGGILYWDAADAVEDTRWLGISGFLIGQSRWRPRWKEGSQFIRASKLR